MVTSARCVAKWKAGNQIWKVIFGLPMVWETQYSATREDVTTSPFHADPVSGSTSEHSMTRNISSTVTTRTVIWCWQFGCFDLPQDPQAWLQTEAEVSLQVIKERFCDQGPSSKAYEVPVRHHQEDQEVPPIALGCTRHRRAWISTLIKPTVERSFLAPSVGLSWQKSPCPTISSGIQQQGAWIQLGGLLTRWRRGSILLDLHQKAGQEDCHL